MAADKSLRHAAIGGYVGPRSRGHAVRAYQPYPRANIAKPL